MRILHIITGLDVGGAETMLYRLATNMDPGRFESRVVSLVAPGPMGDKLTAAGIPVDSLDMQRGIPSPAGLMKLVRLIRHWRPELVQTWLYHADLAGLIATKLAFPLGNGPKVAWNIRCSYMALNEYRRMTGITLKACATLSGLPDAVITNSHEARRFHEELGYAPKRFEVIPNGFDTERFKPDEASKREVRNELSIPDNASIVGHVARLDAMKDHQTLVRAAAQVVRETDAVFVLIGRDVDYGNIDLSTWMREAGLPPERVRLLGERDDIPRLMAAMDVHASSSLGESFPNVVGETMASGIPNAVTDVGDSARLVGETGIVVEPKDAKGLATAITSLLADADERGTKAREIIITSFSLTSVTAKYEMLYKALVSHV